MKTAILKANDDYFPSRPKAIREQLFANGTALDTKNMAIAKANSTYGTFIESIGYGVLIP